MNRAATQRRAKARNNWALWQRGRLINGGFESSSSHTGGAIMTKTMFHMVNQMILLLLSFLDHNMQNQSRVLSSEYIDGRISKITRVCYLEINERHWPFKELRREMGYSISTGQKQHDAADNKRLNKILHPWYSTGKRPEL